MFTVQDKKNITALRMLAIDMIANAKSGHPGLPLGTAPILYVLWSKFLKHNPKNPLWQNRDRFVLSAGHGSALLYSALHLFGYQLSMDDLKQFRQFESKTPGHPEVGVTPGVESTTGPLGQGIAMAVGMAMAEQKLAKQFNKLDAKIIDHKTYVLLGDGDLMEGVSAEAISLAGHLKLHKLVAFYDDNQITIDGSTSLAFTENTKARFEAYNWNTIVVNDANNLEEISLAIEKANAQTAKPTLIICKTHIGYGSPKQDTSGVHGSPILGEDLQKTKMAYSWTYPAFEIPQDVKASFSTILTSLTQHETNWKKLSSEYLLKYADDYKALENQLTLILPRIAPALPSFNAGENISTRVASGKVINSLAEVLPALYGGSADLGPSTNTEIKNYPDRNIYYGVREHAMGAIINGIALHGGLIPFGATFFAFSDYMRPAMRLAALMNTHSIFVFTHDGIGVGEDGPTHQAVEHLSSLRAMPNMTVIRPADANETAFAWRLAIKRKKPVTLVLSRQNLPVMDAEKYGVKEGVKRGAYTVVNCDGDPQIIIIGTGSETQIAIKAAEELNAQGIKARAVSMPSMEVFEEQTEDYKNSVLPPNVKKRIAVEAASSMSWRKYVGERGAFVCLDRFGASAPAEVLYEKFGITVNRVVEEARKLAAQ